MKNYQKFSILLLGGILLAVLIAFQKESTINSKGDNCIDSFDSFAYSVQKRGSIHEKVLPLPPWLYEDDLPIGARKEILTGLVIETSRIGIEGIEVWIYRASHDGLGDSNQIREYLIYYPAEKKWESISAFVDNSEIFVDQLFIGQDGSIWGRNVWWPSAKVPENSNIPPLSKYNEQTKRFEYDKGIGDIPYLPQDIIWPVVILDNKGIFWVLVHNDAIYSYNPRISKITKHLEIPDFEINQAVLSPDGTIYIREIDWGHISLQENEIFQFFPETSKMKPLEIPNSAWPNFITMLVDHEGKLWLGSVGSRDANGGWELMHPKRVLFFWNMLIEEDYRWGTTPIIMESSNGYLWYSSTKGLAWLNPKIDEGCWFTTERSNVVEDPLGYVWLTVDEKLYKYDLNP